MLVKLGATIIYSGANAYLSRDFVEKTSSLDFGRGTRHGGGTYEGLARVDFGCILCCWCVAVQCTRRVIGGGARMCRRREARNEHRLSRESLYEKTPKLIQERAQGSCCLAL